MIPLRSNHPTDPINTLPTFLGFNAFKTVLTGMFQQSTQPLSLKKNLTKERITPQTISPSQALGFTLVPTPPPIFRSNTDDTSCPSPLFPIDDILLPPKSASFSSIEETNEPSPISVTDTSLDKRYSTPPSSNEVFIEFEAKKPSKKFEDLSSHNLNGLSTFEFLDSWTSTTHYILANRTDTSKAQNFLSSKTDRVSQLCITHFWKDCVSGEQSEKIVYAYRNPKNPIPIKEAISILKKY
ncbi:MAG: hypothetical protein JSS09_08170 [Verrucomicrobia bacterium]|nr:hypothetical protein [Verrucomicrobiota bacterium]